MYFLLVNNFKTLSVAVKEEQSHRERLNELMRLKEELVKQVKLEEEKYNIINFSLKLCLQCIVIIETKGQIIIEHQMAGAGQFIHTFLHWPVNQKKCYGHVTHSSSNTMHAARISFKMYMHNAGTYN